MIACVSNGYSDNPVLADPARYGFSAVIAKPYLYQDLLSVVQEAMAKKMP